jgi:hypothetical protein
MSNLTQDNFTVTVKKRLLDKGLNVTSLAGQLDWSRNYVSRAINNNVYRSARRRIAKELGIRGL